MGRTCKLDYCDKPVAARQALCRRHRAQRERGEELRPFPAPRTVEDRLWSKVQKTSSCWLWTASTKSSGYGQLYVDGVPRAAHRVSWELVNGPIPDGLLIDHRCHNKKCVRPDHLRLATYKQNSENRSGPQSNNTSGVLGVHREGHKWYATVMHHQKYHFVGLFYDLKEAEEAVIAKRIELFTHNDKDRLAA